MPPKSKSKPQPQSSGLNLQKIYLTLYNTISLLLWTTCTIQTLLHLLPPTPTPLPQIFTNVYPLLQITQSLALLEILHSMIGLVRAPVMTTVMQVASRILLVWGIMFPFGGVVVGETGIGGDGVKTGDWGFLGCMAAWGVTEIIRYGFFALQVSGVGVPGVWGWLRYNTFYVLYPLGISSECIMVFKALGPAGDVSPLYKWFLVAVLGIYVPVGSYILYTHMIAQRRKALKKKL
ncbi:protein tyrosine phosphatase-like domain-containing protein [Aspergillus ibericus CBS 121593]|uniref:Very-long-chain (3R)-3-hydroxyacyl-CoA dehydratase n=1 Tax=Aspergillus ibericus CBS 121593 TaxID=1448316 RepID=A0A395H7Y7_9EURO|nr:PTPLA-domain-containing protein [Aspergillus ibericus CBS 121593]RAL04032.1 PTPLA-domain-containing protein [Aspergillus ibericus CBS 121593]